MQKKIIVTILILIVCGAGIFYIFKNKGLGLSKYTLNGTIALCVSNEKPTYMYFSNVARPTPQYFSISGNPIPCEFKNGAPVQSCELVISSLKNCRFIYRTDKNISSLPGVFEASAVQAIKTLKDKVR